ncbi:MAG: alpha/beta hydrolase [Actinomycetota bacterium]|nr:alpha/beta hydrolase [Actinomycetota bacterium]
MSTLHHQVEGAGPALLLLHAGVGDLRMWDAQVGELSSAGFTVVRCDLRGFGGSVLTTGASYSEAEDVLSLLEYLDIEMFSLVAASYGGHVALQVATAVAHRVESMVLLAPAAELVDPDESLRALWEEEGRLMEAGDLDGATELNVRIWLGPEADDDARTLVRRMQLDAFVQQAAVGEVDNRELPVALDRLTMPTTILVGAHDLAFFTRTARKLANRLLHARLVELSWAGHLPSLERPTETTRLILDALSQPRAIG